jgi:raffinose/stachyose/melibiose transport system substrate-binding protein
MLVLFSEERMKKISLIIITFALTCGIAFAAGSQNQSAAQAAGGVIQVNIPSYKTGQNVGALFFLPQVERFNTKYAGKYKLVIEEIVQDMYAEKMQQLSQQNKLPALVEGGSQTWIEQYIISGNRFVDLKSWLDSKPELKARLIPAALDYNTKNGKLFSIPFPVVRPVGVFYNPKLYQPSRPFADQTWDQVIAELGDNKIAFMTGENAWTTMLVFSSLIAVQPGGPALMATSINKKITNYNNPIFINAARQLQTLMSRHAAANTLGAAYADAANAFMSMRAALIANGSWMVGDFAPEQSGKWSNGFNGADVRASVLPGNVGIGGTGIGYGYWIPSTATAQEQEVIKAFLEFMCSPEELEAFMLSEGGSEPRMTPSAAFLTKRTENRLLSEYDGAVNAKTILCDSFESAVPNSIAQSEFPRLLPDLISGRLTPEQFCKELSDRAAEIDL